MAEARSRDAWHHTSALMALIANCHRDAKKHRPFTPADFHPGLSRTPPLPAGGTDLSILKQVFVDRQQPTATQTAAPTATNQETPK
jgi:hypothetical protein